jgi:hypothetical protein
MALWRTGAGRKPYVLLMNTDYDLFGPEWVERYFQRSLFYGMFPSMFSHNASENPYWLNPRWYNRDRALFKRYLPLIKQVAEAGWQPVTRAVCDNPLVLVERFGPAPDGTVFYTLFSDGASRQKARLREIDESGDAASRRAATELLSGQALAGDDSGWPVEIEAHSAAVVRVRSRARFSGAAIEAGSTVRLTAEAPMGSLQVLETSADLKEWRGLWTNQVLTSPFAWSDENPMEIDQRFYRLRW